MKKKIITGVIIAVLLLGLLSLFPKKITFQESVPVCTQEGVTSTAEFDVVLWSWWYMPDELRGTIILDGITYEHMEYEKQGESDAYWFAIAADYAADRLDNMLWVSLQDKEFKEFTLSVSKNGETKTYIGPAETAEEASEILGNIYK